MQKIDLRSDTMTRPTANMRQAMADAEVGDDVFGEDPTVNRLQELAGAETVELATEQQFRDMFPGCEVGAMPPLGNLYDMEVFVSETLAEDEEIAFNAGSHTELVRLSYRDFERLADPKVGKISYGD